jgi:hypothetical protein
MDWIIEHLQVVVVIAVVFASWLKQRLDAKAAEREQNLPPWEMLDQEYDFGPAENWQQPMPSVPPPLVSQIPPPLVRQVMDDRENAAQLKRQHDLQERLRQIRETKTTTTGGAAATRTRVAAAQSHAKPILAAKTSIRETLRNPEETRRAVIMREILGPPPGLH